MLMYTFTSRVNGTFFASVGDTPFYVGDGMVEGLMRLARPSLVRDLTACSLGACLGIHSDAGVLDRGGLVLLVCCLLDARI